MTFIAQSSELAKVLTKFWRLISDPGVSLKPTNYSQYTPKANTAYHSMQAISKTFQRKRMTKKMEARIRL